MVRNTALALHKEPGNGVNMEIRKVQSGATALLCPHSHKRDSIEMHSLLALALSFDWRDHRTLNCC